MDFKFVPTNLIKAKNEVIKRHTRSAEISQSESNLEFMKLIKKLCQLNEDDLCLEALALDKRTVERICMYLPHNYYKVSLENLFSIFLIRVNDRLCKCLFYEWQNAYNNSECNSFLVKIISENHFFDDILKECHLSKHKYLEIVNRNNIVFDFGKEAIKDRNNSSRDFKESLLYLGLRESSTLFIQCEFHFYIFCLKSDYLLVSAGELLLAIKKYNGIAQKLFLINFLNELSLEELRKFDSIAEYFLNLTGENQTAKFRSFFVDCPPPIVRKYIDWTNTYKIHKIFGRDERSVFWERYHHEIITKYNYSNSVVMDFEEYVAVEFLGQAMGPCYIYQKSYFEEQLRKIFLRNMYDNTTLRSFLYKHTDYTKNAKSIRNRTGTRLVHNPNPGWQDNFDWVLEHNNITVRIR